MPDLFGEPTPEERARPTAAELDLLGELRPNLRGEAARLRETWQRARVAALRDPRSSTKARAARAAERAYLALRDHVRGMSGAEVAAGLVADGIASPPLPGDHLQLF